MEFAIAKVSTKGQIVIPSFFRNDIHKGRIIMKNVKDMAKDLKEDIVFAERVEKAWQEYEEGKFITKSRDEFLKELKSC